MPLSSQAASIFTQAISTHFSLPRATPRFETISGGSINYCFRVILPGQADLFLKVNDASLYPHLFACEKHGLDLIRQAGFNTPPVVLQFTQDNIQFLLLEWVTSGNKTVQFWKKFGEQLARLHQCAAEQFGFDENNYIGSLPQSNDRSSYWTSFLLHQRLMPQVKLASSKGYLQERHHVSFEKLFGQLDQFFAAEKPSLLHGDLWSGNYICDKTSSPVLIDPAVYFGHRSMDLAMTRLFGGFDDIFYEAYNYYFPFPDNYAEQLDICQLYPLLVHLNLFGLAYLDDIELILKRYAGLKQE